MSGYSILGSGNIYPNSNINSNYVNVDANNNPANFSSNEVPPIGSHGTSYVINNAAAAAASAPNKMIGGGKKRKVSTKYRRNKMKRRSFRKTAIRRRSKKAGRGRRIKTRGLRRTRSHSRSRRSYHQKGGLPYAQYGTDIANTPTYSLAGPLSANLSAMANPPIYNVLSNSTNCADNYNHYNDPATNSRA